MTSLYGWRKNPAVGSSRRLSPDGLIDPGSGISDEADGSQKIGTAAVAPPSLSGDSRNPPEVRPRRFGPRTLHHRASIHGSRNDSSAPASTGSAPAQSP